MTNKTEMVSVPRELLESALTVVARHCTSNWSARIKDGLEEVLAAPAEDVRAVGEEPVACMYDDGSVILPNDCVSQEVFDTICRVNTPLYRHPQRLVVLPELENFQKWLADEKLEHTPYWAWRAAIDLVERLNKC